jgi:hypothetical protein
VLAERLPVVTIDKATAVRTIDKATAVRMYDKVKKFWGQRDT